MAAKHSTPEPAQVDLADARLVLDRAISAVKTGASKHGDTDASFEMIAEFWTIYTRHIHALREHPAIEPHDVAVMMTLLKIVRLTYSYNFDSFVDVAGYIALAAELQPNVEDKE